MDHGEFLSLLPWLVVFTFATLGCRLFINVIIAAFVTLGMYICFQCWLMACQVRDTLKPSSFVSAAICASTPSVLSMEGCPSSFNKDLFPV